MTDDAFYVTAKVGIADYSLTVFPTWDETEHDSFFTINCDGKMIGVLRRTSNDDWEWVDGGLSQDEADAIGNKIDAYFD